MLVKHDLNACNPSPYFFCNVNPTLYFFSVYKVSKLSYIIFEVIGIAETLQHTSENLS